ncbi:MAG: hypothetical protein Kow0080_32100 [Candidatus Promineifilaceae bacterium]
MGLAPYESVLDYVRRFPVMLWRNLPVLWREIRQVDMVWIRLPAANGIWAFLVARVLCKPTVIFVVGDSDQVSRSNPGYRGWKKWVRNIGAFLDWKATLYMARRSLTLAYGSALAEKLRRGGCRQVRVTFTSLLKESDLKSPQSKHKKPNGAYHFLYVGRLSPEKGIHYLLEAATLLAQEGYHLIVHLVGSGPQEDALIRMAQTLAPSQLQIKFWGYLPHGPELDKIWRQADCFVLPSISEGIPKVLLEAMGRGVPVIATHVGGIPDLVVHQESGWLVEPGSADALAGAMRTLIQEVELRDCLAWGGHKFAIKHSWEKQVERIWGWVQEFLQSRAEPDSMERSHV